MLSSSPKQPSKKRRLSIKSNEQAGPSSEVLPLVSPNLVPKSSKDPNRGLYPKKRERRSKDKLTNFACTSFTKASKLIKESPRRKRTESKSEDQGTSSVLQDVFGEEDVPPHKNCDASTSNDFNKTGIKTRLRSHKGKISEALSNKIINYFKPSPRTLTKSTSETSDSSDVQVVASTSGNRKLVKNRKSVSNENETFFKKVHNCYGLFGESESSAGDGINYFERLPIHIIETILCQIPFLDLMRCKFVCSSWNEIIREKKFVEWKKAYYGIKYENPAYHVLMEGICSSLQLTSVDDCFSVLIRYMSNGYCRKPTSDMVNLLERSLKGIDAKNALAERFPELLAKESSAWCILAVAVLLSETVWDVYELYNCLFPPKSDCSLHDVTDAMYCIATFLLYFKNVYNINHGLHYRIYYTLYLLENNLPPEKCENIQSLKIPKVMYGQQSLHNYSESGYSNSHLTYEQIRILNHCLQPKQIVKIVALAGTGKTTTLIHFARLYPQIQFLNVMFNRSVCEDAKRRFPPNVTCKTAHSLAFKIHGAQLRHKLSLKLRPHDLVRFLENCKGTHLHIYSYAKHVLTTIENFTASADKELALEHVPLSCYDASGRFIEELDRQKLLHDALQIWERIINKDEKCLKVTHDIYLKLYQISSPKLSAYKCILVDEAQDCNAAMLDIVLSQNLPVILVGDPNQQIYGFRGARNALQNIKATHTYHLTKSFRFGPEIAYIASCCLEVLKFNKRDTLVGNTKRSLINGQTEGQYAIVARTNVQLFNEAVRLCCEKRRRSNEPTHIHGAFSGGIRSYGFDQILDISLLRKKSSRSGNSKESDNIVITDKFISKFRCFTDLWNYARGADDADLLSKIELVNQHGSNISYYISMIKEKCNHPMELANVIFTTAHKAKGLEFDTVCLTDDYQIGRLPYEVDTASPSPEESSVLYVALTRAKKCLLLPEKVLKFLLAAQEKFEYPVSSKTLLKDNPELKCISCNDHFVPHTALVLVRRSIITANGRIILGGPLCVRCGTEPMVRPQVHLEPLVMYLDPTNDFAHRSMARFVGPLPSDPPIVHNSVRDMRDMQIVYVINVNL